jgi:hypothetical protein
MCVYLLIYYAVMSSMIAAFYVISQLSSQPKWGREPTTEWGREPTRMHEIMFLMH